MHPIGFMNFYSSRKKQKPLVLRHGYAEEAVELIAVAEVLREVTEFTQWYNRRLDI